jgi:uncharacterized delta-60 repeat protein
MRALTLALVFVAVLPAGTAVGAQGDLDPTFDGDGRRVVEALVNVEALALQPDGKVVVVGGFAFYVARLNPDGSTDTGFGDGGVRIVHPGFNWPKDVAIQGDGKIVAVSTGGGVLRVARLEPDGSPDMGFGMDGIRTLAFGGADEGLEAVAIQPDGKILVAGYGTVDKAFVIVRLEPDGDFDSGFGVGGVQRVDVVPGLIEKAYALALQPDGRIVVAGDINNLVPPGTRDIAIARLAPDGSPDLSFGSGGSLRIPSPGPDVALSLALQPDGKILMATRFGAMRLKADGSPDAHQPASSGQAEAVALLQNGKVLVAGEGFSLAGGGSGGGIARLLPDLQLDASFGGPVEAFLGLRSIDVFGPLTFYAMAVGPDGRITLGGHQAGLAKAAVVRLQGDAAPTTGPGPARGPGSGAPGTTATPRPGCAGRVATIVGTQGRNVLRGTRSADVIVAMGGDDVVRAASGDDVVCGGRGRDRLYGERGADRLFGQHGRDVLAGGRGHDLLAGGRGRDSCTRGPGRESCEIRRKSVSR